MNYPDSLRYLSSFLNLERIVFNPDNRLWNLKRMRLLLDWFDHPEKSFFPILIAGTKGKGSTGFFLESILNASGEKTGFYSSPHLQSPRERIRIGSRMVTESCWAKGIEGIRRVLNKKKLSASLGDFTYFEILTLLAALLFKEAGVRVGIFEVGMGGRLDAVNALPAKLAILTPIHLDHEAVLGYTIGQIAGEKAAIIHPGADAIVSPQLSEAMRPIRMQAKKQKARLWPAKPVSHSLGLQGDFQRINAGAAMQAASLLHEKYGFQLTSAGIRRGLEAKNWPGRMELFKGKPDFLLDGAHNPVSISALVRNLNRMFPGKKPVLIFATSRDKRSENMLQILSSFFSEIILTRIPNPRSQEVHTLLLQARPFFDKIFPVGNITEAVQLAKKVSSGQRLVVATGSFYLVGGIRKILVGGKSI